MIRLAIAGLLLSSCSFAFHPRGEACSASRTWTAADGLLGIANAGATAHLAIADDFRGRTAAIATTATLAAVHVTSSLVGRRWADRCRSRDRWRSARTSVSAR